ncbi:MAG: glycosyltransferase [Bacteroidales bacterium]|nr:glycosyltransferase [Bacteroidales bacterium]
MDFTGVLNNTTTLVLLILLVVGFIYLCLYYGLTYLRVARSKGRGLPKPSEVKDSDLPSVSVVIVAHNESHYLKESLPYLLEQDYPNYEVVVVDYTSRDDTPFVLKVCSENYPYLKPVPFAQDVNMFKGKKYPLAIGIKSATKDVILLTDADCLPRGAGESEDKGFGWIRAMMCGYMHGASMVMGYSLVRQSGGVLNAFQQYENLAFNASSLGCAMLGNPYTASGRNLSYRRDFFFGHGGFISHYHIPEGSDDLFVNQNANRANCVVMMDNDAAMVAQPHATYRQWRLARRERMVTKHRYPLHDKLLLLCYPLAQVLFWGGWIALMVLGGFPWEILLGVLVVKLAWQIVSVFLLSRRFGIKRVAFFAPLFELYFLLSNTILYILTLRRKK